MQNFKLLVLVGSVLLLAGCTANYPRNTDSKQKAAEHNQQKKSQIPGAAEMNKPVTVIAKPVTMPVIH